MSRAKRARCQAKTYHVMMRGNERRAIFLDDEDYGRFLHILRSKGAGQDYLLYAYCLMGNHVHLLLREQTAELSELMKKVNGAYVYYFNQKYHRMGHLFQDRFKSEAIETDARFLAVVRYIHNNPVTAGLVEKAEQYKWSSSSYYMSRSSSAPVPIECDYVLGMFWPEARRAIQIFERFSRQTDDGEFLMPPKDVKTSRPLGSLEEAKEYVVARSREKGIELSAIKERAHVAIRNEIIAKLRQESALSVRQIAELLGIGRNIVQRVQ